MAGTLFVVATPIGNLEDLTFRALRTLREVDLVAAEDTRRTAKLLSHYQIHRPMVSLHEHNEFREAPRLIEQLTRGTSIALVSDAGTPGIADPGSRLVALAHEKGVRVVPIPGPSAIVAALSASGLPAAQFVFAGFPPRSGKARSDWLNDLANEPRTVVLFESPHRIDRTLHDIAEILSINRPIIVHRELTKIFEELVKYTNAPSHERPNSTGEFVITIGPSTTSTHDDQDNEAVASTAVSIFDCLTKNGYFTDKVAEELAAKAVGANPSLVHKAVKKARIKQKQQARSLP